MALSDNLARRVVDRYKSRSAEVAHAMAQQIGQPLDGQEPDRNERARLWLLQAPGVDPRMVAQALLSGQVQPAQAVDALYPYRKQLIGSGTPKDRADRAEKLAADAAKWQQEQQSPLAMLPVGPVIPSAVPQEAM